MTTRRMRPAHQGPQPEAPPECSAQRGLTRSLGALAAAGLLVTAAVHAAPACNGPHEVREARPLAVKAYVLAQGRSVLTFAGYSAAGYEDPAAMLAHAERELASHRPAEAIVNIGATPEGIGAVYELAKRMGFATMGIVSSQARIEKVALAPCADIVFYVPDAQWGGLLPDGKRLSPTSETMVETGSEFVAIGGGDVTRDEMLAARRAGKRVTFLPAEMNHEIARERARRKNQPLPSGFRGSTHPALSGGEQRPAPAGRSRRSRAS